MIDDGVVQRLECFVLFIQQAKGKKIATKKAVFVLNSARIASRDIELPLVKEKQLREMIAMNASDYFPVDLSQYKLVHQIIEKIDRPEEKKLRLSLLLCLMTLFCHMVLLRLIADCSL